ncbi:hypothetical protein FNV43_RR20736 [Rhamnella rubrinervis]|uniref:Uncharacterized protein n=1 Tax=Rhamnella rubrinervis TaxID=2594499 RepID=A0A8K0GXA2_9ROSA|nr:hypothetical protein FNV43_RR20736 [Rhamnella rubrinervis]
MGKGSNGKAEEGGSLLCLLDLEAAKIQQSPKSSRLFTVSYVKSSRVSTIGFGTGTRRDRLGSSDPTIGFGTGIRRVRLRSRDSTVGFGIRTRASDSTIGFGN